MDDTTLVSSLTHADVAALLAEGGSDRWVYLDVRTPEEFATGHVPGAFNIQYQLGTLSGLHTNPDFVDVVCTTFPHHAQLILGCRSGKRAASAEHVLKAAGYTQTHVHLESLVGSRDAFGRQKPGWVEAGFPVVTAPEPGRTYAELHVALQHVEIPSKS
jgi:rhodanese-related sulfurtransferase